MSDEDTTSDTPKRRRVVGPRFDIFNPMAYANLHAVWKHRDSLRKNLLKAQERAGAEVNGSGRPQKDVARIQRNLKQLEENQEHFFQHTKTLMDLLLVEHRMPVPSDAADVLHRLTDAMSAGLDKTAR